MIFILLIILTSFSSFSSNVFILDEVNFDCKGSILCNQRKMRYQNIIGEYRSLIHLKDTLKIMASDGGYQSFSYSLERSEKKNILNLHLSIKPILKKINLVFEDRILDVDPSQIITLREGDFYEPLKLSECNFNLKSRLVEIGFPLNSHSYDIVENDGEVVINYKITLGKPRVFKRLKIDTKSSFIKYFLQNKLLSFYNQPFDLNNLKIHMSEIQKDLFNYGYYLLNLEFTPIFKNNRVILEVKVSNDQIFAFDFKNLKREHRDVIHSLLVDLFRKYKRPLSNNSIKHTLVEHYHSKALLDAKFIINSNEYINKSNEKVLLYRIFFDEDGKTEINSVSFKGNSFFSEKKIKNFFYKEAFELASIGFYDKDYFNYFQEYLRNQYIENGFVQARVFDPVYVFNKKKKTSKVEYAIQEGQRAFVNKIEFDGVPEELQLNLQAKLKLKVGKPFNPIQMVDDVKSLIEFLQEQGYYFAEVLNSSESDLVKYNSSGTSANILFKVDTGPIVKFNRPLFLGNDKTRTKVLVKKVFLKKDELVTPSKTQEIESAISATGLFNSVSVSPVRHNSKNASTDLLIKVSEREYGLIEIAPGYRTDLGIKLTGTITYLNIGGYNRSVSFRSELNRRTSFTTIDPERAKSVDHILEHNTSVTYNQDDIFDTLVDGSASTAYQTRRFYAFDANIFRLNGTLSRELTKNLSSSVRYQYEDITQYYATEEINNGSFQIGSLTPSLTLDLRNSQVNATKGSFLNLSCEFANPYFLSQKQSDLTINYYKLISRNRFYLPFRNGTIALSMVGGIQENLASQKRPENGELITQGYIPTIKVFRLAGMDIIRGFTDEEMNRLTTGEDVSEYRVDNKAYLANFKLEPRYFLNDSLMAGIFYDAGRVFIDKFDLGELRDSVGLTFKVVTPVGTLDFDYGIKLLRKKDASGRLEDPGRFHVSIGFF